MTKKIKLPYSMLIYDIETKINLKAYVWRLNEQYIGHDQLDPAFSQDAIICIAYKWYGEEEVYVLEGENAVKEFDTIARTADVCLGKNSDRFDVKHINTQRMLQKLKPYPEWTLTNDDLEKQCRKAFTFPSQSLDYISSLLGFGGKVKMQRQDWIDIANMQHLEKFIVTKKFNSTQVSILCNILFKDTFKHIMKKGKNALAKMMFYNKKDVLDTEKVLTRVLPYIKLRRNAAVQNDGKGCTTCGSTQLIPTKIVTVGKTKFQSFDCLEHEGYGGRATFKYDKYRHKVFGSMG